MKKPYYKIMLAKLKKEIAVFLLFFLIPILSFSQGVYDQQEHSDAMDKINWNDAIAGWFYFFVIIGIFYLLYNGLKKINRQTINTNNTKKNTNFIKKDNEEKILRRFNYIDPISGKESVLNNPETDLIESIRIYKMREEVNELSILECEELLEDLKGNTHHKININDRKGVKQSIYVYNLLSNKSDEASRILKFYKKLLNDRIRSN